MGSESHSSQGKTLDDVTSGKGGEGQLITGMLAAFLYSKGKTVVGTVFSPEKVGSLQSCIHPVCATVCTSMGNTSHCVLVYMLQASV